MTRVVVVGLGPGDEGLVTTATLDAIAACPVRFVRTRRHPSVGLLGEATSFDDVYDAAEELDDVYSTIVDRLVAAANEHGEVLYAVPGSPSVRERSVALLRSDLRVEVEVVPAMSFLDLTWSRLGIDPVAERLQVVDGHRFAVDAAGLPGPMLVCHCDRRDALSEIKLSIEPWPAARPVVLQGLGTSGERIFEVDWVDLDRVVEPDHLTSVYLPRLESPVGAAFGALVELMRRLRADCPWDAQQTHASLRAYLLEESYEVLEAIDAFDPDSGEGAEELEEELGDLLFQVVFHSALAAEEGWFDLADVAAGVTDKLRARHPHVFGDAEVANVADLRRQWEERKVAEKGRGSTYEGIPLALPALAYASKVLSKAASAGDEVSFDPDLGPDDGSAPISTALLAVVGRAREAGVDPEQALRRALDTWLSNR